VAAPAAGFAALAWRLPTRDAAEAVLLAAWLVFTAFGVVLAGIDASVNRLPRPILAAAAAVLGPLVAVAAGCARDPSLAVRAVVVAAAFGGVYLILALVGLVGMGDVYLAALLGLLLGTGPPASILAGALTPYLLGGPVTAVRLARRRIERGSQIAWGAYLIAGTVLAKVLFP
jgi:leader peptidase (prepilin peptidase)/N-methyltransferase